MKREKVISIIILSNIIPCISMAIALLPDTEDFSFCELYLLGWGTQLFCCVVGAIVFYCLKQFEK